MKSGVHETTEFLELFLRNLLLNEKNELHNRSMHIHGIFGEKQDIETMLTARQQKQYEKLVAAFGKSAVFGRSDMVTVLDITPSPASALIKKLLEAGKIEAVTGHGKGKYVIK